MFGNVTRTVVFLESIGGTYTTVGKKKLGAKTDQVRYRKKSYIIDAEMAGYRSKQTIFYLVDKTTGAQISLMDAPQAVSPELIDTILSREMGKQLVAGLNTASVNVMNIVFLCLGLGAGVAVGITLGMNFL